MKHWMKSLMVVWVCVCVACAPLAVLGADSPQGGTVELYGVIRNEATETAYDMDWQADTNKYGSLVLSDTLYSLPFRWAPIQFHSGLFYTVDFSGWIFKRSSSSMIPGDEIIATVQLHLHSTNGYWVSSKHNILNNGVLNVPAVSWYCTESFECDAVYFSFHCTDDSVSEVYVAVPTTFTYSYQTEMQQIEGVLSGQTDRIISGDGLKAPAGIPDDDIKNTFDQFAADENDVEISLGNGGFDGAKNQLDSIMQLPTLGPDFTAAFAKINTVFSRVVSTFDLSVALTFMLVFGLALFVIGRRVR